MEAIHTPRTTGAYAEPASWWQGHDFFTNFGNYMPRMHCMRNANGQPDWPWIVAIVIPTLAVTVGYIRIFIFWRRAYLAEAPGDRNRKLMDLANIFIWCAFCGYVLSLLMFVWPAYRLVAAATTILAIWTWRFAFNLDAFRVSLSARRLERELGIALRERNAQLERVVDVRTRQVRDAQAEIEQKRLMEAVLNAANYSIVSTDVAGIIQTINRTACEWLGYQPDELVGKSTPVLFHDPAQIVVAAEVLTKAFDRKIEPGFDVFAAPAASGQIDNREWTYIRKDGTSFTASLSVAAIRDENEIIVGYLAIGIDLTEQKAVALAAARLAALVESSSDAIIGKTLSLDGIVTSWNRGAAQILGYTAAEMIGSSIMRVVPTDRRDEEHQVLARVARGEHVEHFETVRQAKDGSLIDVSISVSPIIDVNGKIIGASKIMRDITERKRAEETICDLNQNLEKRVAERTTALQASNNELEAFCYSVSHDLRTPLRALSGFAQALREDNADKLDEHGIHYVNRICTGSQRMGQLIDDLLGLSRVTRVEMTREPVDLSKLVRELAEELRTAEPERDVNIVVVSNLVANTDPRLLRIVLTNLLANAWKFTSKRPHACIEFGCTGKDGSTEYFVRDDGAGFDQAHTGNLFGAFQRLHTEAEFPGTGIGLATVRRIIERQGGRVWAKGVVGQGATFHFTL